MHVSDLKTTPINRSRIRQYVPNQAKILEISPFWCPVFTGSNVFYFDVVDKKGLIDKAKLHKLPTERIPDIHYISQNGDLGVVLDKFDVVFSSHVIEHTIDLITHLNQVYSVLNENGNYILYIPDYRYCFDHFRRSSTFPEIVEAYIQKRKNHSPKAVIEQIFYSTHNNAAKHWLGYHGRATYDVEFDVSAFTNCMTEIQKSEDYIDCHNWRFTPASFVSHIRFLRKIALCNFYIAYISETMPGTFEFCVVLTKNPDFEYTILDRRGYYSGYIYLVKHLFRQAYDKIFRTLKRCCLVK
jgi:SAM-dependent methyltransferase